MRFHDDLRHAARSLLRNKSFSALAALTLAVGIGLTTAIFSVASGVLLRPLPFRNASQIVVIREADRQRPSGNVNGLISHVDMADVAAAVPALEATALWRRQNLALGAPDGAELVIGAQVTADFFRVFSLEPVAGRAFVASDDVLNGPRVAIVADGFWRTRLQQRSDVLGSTLTLNGVAHEIIGVIAADVAYPTDAQIWLPFQNDAASCGRGCANAGGIAKLRPDVSVQQAQVQLSEIADRLSAQEPGTNANITFRVASLHDALVGNTRTGILVLLGAVAMVLLIACANVANLLLVRGAARRTEIAVRSALGADQRRILSYLLAEHTLLAIGGGVLGLVLAAWGVAALKAVAPAGVPRLDEVGIDARTLYFTIGLTFATAAIFGIAPALRATRTGIADSIRQGGRGHHGDRGAGRLRNTVLVAEVALSIVLLIGAGLMLRSVARLNAVDLGLVTSDVVQFRLTLPEAKYRTSEESVAFMQALDERLEQIPGVTNAAVNVGVPLTSMSIFGNFSRTDRPAPTADNLPNINYRAFDDDGFAVLGIGLLRGRTFTEADRYGGEPVAIINEAAADAFWPGEDPIGRQLQMHVSVGFPDSLPRTIVGIARDFRRTVSETPVPEVYVPYAQAGADFPQVTLKFTGIDAGAALAAARAAVAGLDPDLPLARAGTLEDLLLAELATPRFYMLLLLLFAVLALGLAAVGIYGVVAYVVTLRTREIAVRMALGAEIRDVLRQVVWDAARPAIVGAALGGFAAMALTQAMRTMLFETAPADPLAISGAILLLLAAVAAATVGPALRAARIPPALALRQD